MYPKKPFKKNFGFSAGPYYATGGFVSVIRTIQTGTITISSGNLTNTFSLPTPVTSSNAALLWNGVSTTLASQTLDNQTTARIALTSSAQVTASRDNANSAVTVAFTVLEFASGVNTIQSGTIVISSGTNTNTASVTTTSSNAFVVYNGSTVPTAVGANTVQNGVSLTSSAVVTAFGSSNYNGNQNVNYTLIDLDSTIVSGIQQKATLATGAVSSDTDMLTAVSTTSTALLYGGVGSSAGLASNFAALSYTTVLTSNTVVTKDRNGTGATARTVYYTAVQFNPSCLKSNVQRGTISLTGASNSATASLTPVSTSKAFANWNGFNSSNANANIVMPTMTLSSSLVTVTANTAGGVPNVAYEVVEFL